MRLIPGRTKVKIELFKGVSLVDILIVLVASLMAVFVFTSSLPGKFYIVLGIFIITAALLLRMDNEPNYIYIRNMIRHMSYVKNYKRSKTDASLENREEDADEPVIPTKAELKARKKAEKAEYKADDKILKDRKTTKEEKDAIWLKRANQSAAKKKEKKKLKAVDAADMKDVIAFSGINDGFIEYGGSYYGAVLEIPPVEFRFFSSLRRNNAIESGLGRVLRSCSPDYGVNILKIERPMIFDHYIDNEMSKIDDLKKAYEHAAFNEEELKARLGTLYERIDDLNNICYKEKVVEPFYYIVLFDSDKIQLNNSVSSAIEALRSGEMNPRRLNDTELAVFLKYTNQLDFDERLVKNVAHENLAEWAMPKSVNITPKNVEISGIITHNMRVVNYPSMVDDAWLATVMSLQATKVMVKCKPMNRDKAVRSIDFSLQELRGQYAATGIDSKRIELQNHIETLSTLLSMLQGDNESLYETNIYISGYDIKTSRGVNPDNKKLEDSMLATFTSLKKSIRRLYAENNLRVNGMDFNQMNAFIGSQVSAYDPMAADGRSMPSNTVAGCFPWVFAHITDTNGVKLGSSDGCPVFVDFFRRDSERVNSNMVIVGKSGSGKSYATKTLLSNIAADDAKIFILDPENEYSELAANLHGKCINVGNAKFGRLNPFNIITALDDDDSEGGESTNSYATHLQFLEEFFKQILPDCEKDALEYLNSLIDRMYLNCGITADTNLSKLKPEDYPTFDDLYDIVLREFQSSSNEYLREMLRKLMNYISKFAAGGRNAAIWNGPSSITTDENFTVFNFQSLLSNRNGTIANAQMLLVLKYIDNEIIKNREYNKKYDAHRKVVVVIDEAHVFIDTKYPIALDFMFQLAKRIRKYNGMQIVITQNIKDFVGSEEIARKSTAIINACQYSFIFALAPNDMDDLCKLYEKAGGINAQEQEQIVSAPRGQAFAVLSSQSRSTFKIEALPDMVKLFKKVGFKSPYFEGEENENDWDNFIVESRPLHNIAEAEKKGEDDETDRSEEKRSYVEFASMTAEEYAEYEQAVAENKAPVFDDADRKPPVRRDTDDGAAVVFETLTADEENQTASAEGAPASQTVTAVSSDEIDAKIKLAVKDEYRDIAAELYKTIKAEVENELLKQFISLNLQRPATVAVEEQAAPAQSEPERTLSEEDAEKLAEAEKLLAGMDAEEIAAEPAETEAADTPEQTETAEETETPESAEKAEGTKKEEEEDIFSFDIMKMLVMDSETLSSQTSAIERLLDFGTQDVIEITFEDLTIYNSKH